ncbi:winged helix-turn-helix transcriptional regulator [Sneathiella limimaris]|uniref:winged helix-turn-helix transcriptional regulator n=1 Tax=Sneathiella limimaris TaxID=1964213 RepID=UPI00146D6A49|nr:helix-turn-helix domain-containing protein [Sneathiella limimaris]
MAKLPGHPVRGSTTGRPIMALLDLLGQRWTLRILWELKAGAMTFRALREVCDGVSPTLLNTRLKDLRQVQFVELTDSGYALTKMGRELVEEFSALDRWAEGWAKTLNQ